MKLNLAARPVEHVGAVAESKSFAIKSTGKAFQVLSSKLYKNKIAAAIRELSTNAYDSHIAVWRRDLPFEVHLPTVFEPYFAIRDFGTGLTHDQVENVFTVFFESTKEDSNDFIGALGLGCKAPFSYVDSFVVYTYNGTERTAYECFLENGTPMISKKSSVPSNELTGVEITFSVQGDDAATFQKEAASIYQWFTVRPTITGGTVTIPEYPKLRGSCWSVNHDDSFNAIMGQVRYPLDPKMVESSLKGLTVHFDIGEIDIQAGREELSYDRDTIAAIQARLATVEREIEGIYKKLFRGCENLFEACHKASRSMDQRLFRIKPPMWRGRPVSGSFTTAFAGLGKITEYPRKDAHEGCSPTDMTMFICDVDKTSIKRHNLWLKGEGANKVGFLVQPAAGTPPSAFADVFGRIPVVFASSVPIPSKKAVLRTLGTYCGGRDIRERSERNIDLNAGGVVIMSRNLMACHPLDSDKVVSTTILDHFHRIMLAELYSNKEGDGKPVTDVVIVPWTRKKELDPDIWTNVYDLIADIYKVKRKSKDFKLAVQRARAFETFSTVDRNTQFGNMAQLTGLTPGPAKSFIDNWNACRDAHRTHDCWRVYENVIKEIPSDKGRDESLHEEWKVMSKLYPLLVDCYSNRSGSNPVKDIVAREVAVYVNAKTEQITVSKAV